MTNNLITLDDKLTARNNAKLALIDQLKVDYKRHDKLIDECTVLKICLDAGLKNLDVLKQEIKPREKRLINMYTAAEAAKLKKELWS